ncbi:MAG TPA: hypothetical protein VIG30_12450 [Ktedonobacterales bacterium]|jgi:hypothetical protein
MKTPTWTRFTVSLVVALAVVTTATIVMSIFSLTLRRAKAPRILGSPP